MADVEFTIGATDQASGVINTLGGSFTNLAKSLLGPAVAFATLTGAITKTVEIFKESVSLAAEAEKGMARLSATLKATGRGSEISASQIDKAAVALMKLSTFDDESIVNAFNTLMKFDSIPTSKMEDIVKTAMDMSAALGGDLQSNAESIGRLLETGLIPRTWGFNAALKAQIQEMIKTGDSAGALNATMTELNRRYGGQAAAQLDTYSGALQRSKIAADEAKEAFGRLSTPILTDANNIITKGIYAWMEMGDTIKITVHELRELPNSGYRAIELLKDANNALAVQEDRLIAARDAAFSYGKGINAATDANDPMIISLKDIANSWQEAGWNALVAGAELDGQITYDEIKKLTDYGVQLGIMTQAEADAKLAAYNLTTALNSIPKNTDITLTMWYISQDKGMSLGPPQNPSNIPVGTGGGGGGWTLANPTAVKNGTAAPLYINPNTGGYSTTNGYQTNVGSQAGGGNISGWAMVGDSPGGGVTPYTEFVYAPHGATVYNQSQMSGKSAPPMSGGGSIPPMMGAGHTINIYNPSPAAAEKSVRRELLRLNYLGMV
jgi:hypothetical protein